MPKESKLDILRLLGITIQDTVGHIPERAEQVDLYFQRMTTDPIARSVQFADMCSFLQLDEEEVKVGSQVACLRIFDPGRIADIVHNGDRRKAHETINMLLRKEIARGNTDQQNPMWGYKLHPRFRSIASEHLRHSAPTIYKETNQKAVDYYLEWISHFHPTFPYIAAEAMYHALAIATDLKTTHTNMQARIRTIIYPYPSHDKAQETARAEGMERIQDAISADEEIQALLEKTR